MIKVFISHSTSGEAENDPALQIREALYAHLAANGYDPFLDLKDMRVAEDWNLQMHRALYRCQVAVVLLTKRAIDSKYVQRELAILLSRTKTTECPLIVPVLIGDIRTKDIRDQGFPELLVPHAVHHRKHQTSIENEVRATTETICAKFPTHEITDPPGDKWSSLIETRLEGVSSKTLEVSGKALGLDEAECDKVGTPVTGPRLLAIHMLAHGGKYEVATAVDEIGHGTSGSRERVEDLVYYLQPAWVDRGQAHRVLPPAEQAGPFVVTLNAADQQIGLDYLNTATSFRAVNVRRGLVNEPSGEDSEESLLAEMETALCSLAQRRPRGPLPENFQLPAFARYVLIITAEQRLLDKVLNATEKLHKRFPEVVVFVLTGQQQVDRTGVVQLKQLAEGEETNALDYLGALQDVVDRVRSRR